MNKEKVYCIKCARKKDLKAKTCHVVIIEDSWWCDQDEQETKVLRMPEQNKNNDCEYFKPNPRLQGRG